MRHTIALLLLMLSPLAATAQEFGMNWIRSATAQEGHGVLFRKMVTGAKEPDHAWLEVASQGYVDVYVNERNIDRHAPVVSQKAPITVRRFDITPFLREDTNVVAVEYFPRDTMPADRQLAINIYGLYTDGSPLTLQTDATWLCRASQRQWMDGTRSCRTPPSTPRAGTPHNTHPLSGRAPTRWSQKRRSPWKPSTTTACPTAPAS